MAAIQIVKVNESIINYFKYVMDFQNESEEFKTDAEAEFKTELEKALNNDEATKEIKWVK